MTVHRSDLVELHEQAEDRVRALEKESMELDRAYSDVQERIKQNQEQQRRAAKTRDALRFLLGTLTFDE